MFMIHLTMRMEFQRILNDYFKSSFIFDFLIHDFRPQKSIDFDCFSASVCLELSERAKTYRFSAL